jgi:SAM-dependent methyltransferase
MLKMYAPAGHGGGESAEQWSGAWGSFDHAAWLRDAARICHNDPISRWVEPAVARGGLFLEGGCGLAHWVKWLHHRGHEAVGCDFAPALLASARRLDPALQLLAADVRALPFADGSVQTYLSNGVVEHWEDGPDAGLVEARRVLAPDGLFLCTVPDASWLRRRLHRGDLTARGTLRSRRVDAPRVEPLPEGLEFYQYAFETDEFAARLRAHGFDVLEATGQSLIYGLFEIPGVQRVYDAAYRTARVVLRRPGTGSAAGSYGGAGTQAGAEADPGAKSAEPEPFDVVPRTRWVERVLFREEPETPLIGPVVAWAAERCSTMRMYVARPR